MNDRLSYKKKLEAVRKNGINLMYFKEQTDELCLNAVKQNPLALVFVKNQTKKICITAIRKDPFAFFTIHITFTIQEYFAYLYETTHYIYTYAKKTRFTILYNRLIDTILHIVENPVQALYALVPNYTEYDNKSPCYFSHETSHKNPYTTTSNLIKSIVNTTNIANQVFIKAKHV